MRFVSWALLWMATSLACSAFNFPYPDNKVGWVDPEGRLSVWLDRDLNVRISDSEVLPVRFRFSSEGGATGLLGRGWWFPLLDSAVIQESETVVRLTTLGGEYLFLERNSASPESFSSPGGEWKGTLVGDKRFEVAGPDGWKFVYEDGIIHSASSPSGVSLRWLRPANGGQVTIMGSGSKALLTAKLDAKGLIQSLEGADAPPMQMRYDVFPLTTPAPGSERRIIKSLVPSLSVVDYADGLSQKFHVELQPEDGFLRMEAEGVVKDGASRGQRVSETFTWSPSDGLLKSDRASSYSTTREQQGQAFPKIVRTKSDGKTEGYWYDANAGVAYVGSAGSWSKMTYIMTPGPSFLKYRKLEEGPNIDGPWKMTESFQYDDKGGLLRRIDEKFDIKIAEGSEMNSSPWPKKVRDASGNLVELIEPLSSRRQRTQSIKP